MARYERKNQFGRCLSAHEVARLLGLGLSSVYEAAKRGEIPHQRVGKRLLFWDRAIYAWMEQNAIAETTKP